MRRTIFFAAAVAFLLGGVSSLVQAQDRVAHCVGIEDDGARLACFDAATRGRGATTSAAPAPGAAGAPSAGAGVARGATVAAPAAAATQAAEAVPASADGDFGMTAERQAGPDAITATVRSVAPHSIPGRWVVTLDNDQVWEQRETTAANRRPKPGDSVTIERSSLGSYLMTASGRGSSRVKRLR